MNPHDLLAEMETLGTEQNRKIYRKHGVIDPMFGVSYAHVDKLQKRIKKNHALALELWASGNHDARVLATKIADPAQMTAADIERWVADINNYTIANAVSDIAAKVALDAGTITRWSYYDDEWLARIGWAMVGQRAMYSPDTPDAFFAPFFERIAHDIHSGKNRVREAMNMTLIAMGTRNTEMEAKAIAIAGEIGKVYVDHGETGCKTPDAAAYIRKTNERTRQRATAKAGVA